MFKGFSEETIRFFLDLRFHNDYSFFKGHEDEYQTFVKEPFHSFIEAMAPTVQKIANDMDLRPGKCMARIHRDTRFSKDKSPYRDHMWVLFRRGGEQRDTAVIYWFELSPDAVEWGLGFWGKNRPAMDALRKHMVAKPDEVRKILRKCGIPDETLQIYGDHYKHMPPPNTLPIELAMLYPCKEIYIKRVNTALPVCYSEELVDIVAKDFLRLKPLYELLRSAADEGIAQLDA